MTTKLGLYGGPVTAPASILTAVNATITINVEVAGQVADSSTITVNVEVNAQVVVSATVTVNVEVADAFVTGGPGNEGSSPDAILNLPTFAVASRLRADLYTWNANLLPPARSIEFMGPKIGTAPIMSISSFEYTSELDAVGTWSILIPANDEHAAAIIDGTAEIIKIYSEDVGHIFTGRIEDYEIVDQETMRVNGRDMLFQLADQNCLWRLDAKNIYSTKTTKRWIDYYQYVMLNLVHGIPFQFESNMPNNVVYQGNSEGEFIGLVPKYASQSILEVLRDFNSMSGAHFRTSPTSNLITFGAFGDDSGLIIAPISEDDPLVREQGALVLRSFSYIRTKEELVNMIVVQGSNDSFGIAVELRHTDRILSIDNKYFVRKQDEDEGDTSFPSGSSQLFITRDVDGDYYSIDMIPQDYLDDVYQTYIGGDNDADEPTLTAGGLTISQINFGGSAPFLHLGWPEDKLAVGIPFTVSQNMFLTFASVYNMGGIGQFRMAVAPSSGGIPDMANAYVSYYTNYFNNRLPGNYAQRKTEQNPDRTSAQQLWIPNGNTISEEDREYGILTELMAFWDMGEIGANSEPWPLLTPGSYFLVVWGLHAPQVNIPNMGLVHQGNQTNILRILKNTSSASTKIMDSTGTWASFPDEIVASIYGRAESSSYPYAVEGMLAESIQDNGSGHRVFFIRDVQSIKEHGLRQAAISFTSALDASESVRDIIPSSDLLHDQAQVYLTNHKDPFEKLSVTCTGLFRLPYVGQKVRFVYRGTALNENGEYKWLDINSDWYVLSITWQITNEGLEHTLTLTNVPDDIVNPRNLSADFFRHLERSKNNLGEIHLASRRLGAGIVTQNTSTEITA